MRLLSGDLINMGNTLPSKQSHLFPGTSADEPWTNVNSFKRFFLHFPFYPFRTLCPRDLINFKSSNQLEFDASSPMIPANTQININFKRRTEKLLDYMLPFNLDMEQGTITNQLTADTRKMALRFTVPQPPAAPAAPPAVGAPPAAPLQPLTYIISKVEVVIDDLYLQVQ